MFLVSLAGHWYLAWRAYAREAHERGHAPEVAGYVEEVCRDTLENWQSEFLQLVWQVAGLSFLLSIGSPQSRESSDRVEAKLDGLLEQTSEGLALRQRLDREFRRRSSPPT